MAAKEGTTSKKATTTRKKTTKSLDEMVEARKTTGTDFQAYLKACMQEGRVL